MALKPFIMVVTIAGGAVSAPPAGGASPWQQRHDPLSCDNVTIQSCLADEHSSKTPHSNASLGVFSGLASLQ